jgi:hypothetical protein
MSSAPELERVQLPGTLTTLPGDQGTCPPEGSSGPDVVDAAACIPWHRLGVSDFFPGRGVTIQGANALFGTFAQGSGQPPVPRSRLRNGGFRRSLQQEVFDQFDRFPEL